ncbi:MAG TPA: metallophosphoesterase [Asanoa sp.]
MAVLALVGVVLLVTGLIHLYLWKRLVRDTTHKGPRRRAGGALAIVLGLLVPATLIGTAVGVRFLAWPGYVWLALMFYLLVVLALLEIPMLGARLALRRRRTATPATTHDHGGPDGALSGQGRHDHGVVDRDRRLLLARGAAIFAGLTAAGITGYGTTQALGPPRLDRRRIGLAKLPRSMDGLRIATVADIHLGPLAGRPHAERIVAAINRLDADIVAVVGDLVDGSVAELGPAAAPLRDIRSRNGAFFVTGNHEYYSGAEEWVAEVQRLGMRALRNERVEIAGLDLAGVNDLTGGDPGPHGGPDLDAALGGRDPARPVVLLAHQPVVVHDAARHKVDLQLSGHTHGGQMAPFNLVVGLAQPVVSGYAMIGGTQLYVTNGAGFWGPPVRVGAPPQVTLIELRSAA